MTETYQGIFDNRGMIRADIETVRPSIPPERLEVFDELVSAYHAANAAESAVTVAAEREAKAVKAHTLAQAALPVRSFMDEWRTMRGKR